MQRTLSIRSTPFLKFVLAPVWFALTGYFAWRLWADPGGMLEDSLPLVRWSLLALIVASLIVLFAFGVPLKRVRLDSGGLRISNYVREITAPFDAILGVRQNWLPTFRLVTLELRPGLGLSQRVIFIPADGQRFAFWRRDYGTEDALVTELRRLAGPRA